MHHSSIEQEILKRLSEGDSAKEIARDINLTIAKVERTIYDMRMERKCRNAVQLVADWLKSSLTPPTAAL